MRVLSFFIFVFLTSNLISQNLEKHHWKDRLLLVFADRKTSEKLNSQIHLLSKDKTGLLERKLVIYQVVKNKFRTNLNTDWILSTKSLKPYRKKSAGFEVILIGLDGGVKHRQTKILSLEKLLALIDGMPMRKRVLKN